MRSVSLVTLLVALLTLHSGAHATNRTFPVGSLIIPMDTTYQDRGMLRAYGLLYALLRADVPVAWVIAPQKTQGQVDFTTSAVDVTSDAVIDAHGYRGGPFVIDEEDAAVAMPIIDLWIAQNPDVHVHRTTVELTANVRRHLVAAPTIGVFADGHEDIAFGYLNAAGIPDSIGQVWPDRKDNSKAYPGYPDVLNVVEIAGPTTTDHSDGALFDGEGNPIVCQLMTMHWGVDEVVDEVVAEVRDYLAFPTHFFAECQAVNAIENNPFGHFLTPNGFLIGAKPGSLEYTNADYPFAQLDGVMKPVGGSEASYSLPAGDAYKDSDVVMVSATGTPIGVQDVWMTGYIDGRCKIIDDAQFSGPRNECTGFAGKISYLGGHKYEVKLPVSTNGDTQGTRLFLNSLFEADCAAAESQPYVYVHKEGPPTSTTGNIAYTIEVSNFGPGSVLDVTVTDVLPEGAALIGAPEGATYDVATHTLTWSLGSIAAGGSEELAITMQLGAAGTYTNTADLAYRVGLNTVEKASNTVTTHFGGDADADGCPDDREAELGTRTDTGDTDNDGVGDCVDICPLDANPSQDTSADANNCGTCGNVCTLDHATAICDASECVIGACDEDWTDDDGIASTGCEATCTATSATDVTCDGVDDDCDGTPDDDWTAERCGIGACASSSACVAGEERACVPGEAGVESADVEGTCTNGRDDDCDDVTDEDPECAIVAADPGPEPIPEQSGDATANEDTGAGTDASTATDASVDEDTSADEDTGTGEDTGTNSGVDATTSSSDGTGNVESAAERGAADDSGCGCNAGGMPDPTAFLLALSGLVRRRRA